MTIRRYELAADFRRALDQRLRVGSKSPDETLRRRRSVAFDRLLARLAPAFGDELLLKGGFVVELRVEGARATQDVDLRLGGSPARVLDRLAAAVSVNLDDFMEFDIRPDTRRPVIAGDSIRCEGQRYAVASFLGGRVFVQPFGLDIGFGDPVVGEIEVRCAPDLLAFAGIEPARVRVYPVETHVAEKVHAYTLPRVRVNSRVKDLPDIALLASSRDLRGSALRQALEATFGFRSSHALPRRFEDPPSVWSEPYRALAESDGLPWPTLPSLVESVRAFLDPVLADSDCGTWDRRAWMWMPDE